MASTFDWGSVVNAGAGVLGSILNQFLPLSNSAKQAFNLNVQETMRQEQRQEDFFNQYQSIGAQVRQMQEAGLNPALAAGGVSGTSPVNGPSAAMASDKSVDMAAILMQTMQLVSAMKDAKLGRDLAQSEQDRKNKESDAKIRLWNAQAWAQEFQNFHADEIFSTDMEQRNVAIEEARKRISGMDDKHILDTLGITKAELENDILEFQRQMAQFSAEHQEEVHNSMMKMSDADLRLKESEIYKNSQEVREIQAHIRNMDADTAKKYVESKKIGQEAKNLLMDYIVAKETLNDIVSKAHADALTAQGVAVNTNLKARDRETTTMGKSEKGRAENFRITNSFSRVAEFCTEAKVSKKVNVNNYKLDEYGPKD